MKMRVLTLGSCIVLISLFVVWYGFVLPQDALAAPSGKCCLETGECVEVSSTDCDAMGGVFSGAGTTCEFGPFPDCPIPPISVAACCLPDDTCTVITLCECDVAGGTPAGVADCADADCGGGGCAGSGESCTADGDCCSNKCKNGKCRGN